MNLINQKRLLLAGCFLLIVPASLLAQKEKEKTKEKKETQQIVITRPVEDNGKTVIEIDGDKVKVNGKDASDNKDVRVRVNRLRTGNSFYRVNPGTFSYNFNNDNNMSLFTEDENRAMLGVVTEGNDEGAEIQSITKESAAEKAGLKKGDVITRIGDKKIEGSDDVIEAIHSRKPGEKVNITYLRDGKEQKVTAELGKWKGIKMNAVTVPRMNMDMNMNDFNTPEPMMPGRTFVFNSGRPRLGLSIQDAEDGNGVKVLDVDDESNAEKAGIKENDIITSIDDKPVKDTEDVTNFLRENKDKITFKVNVLRDGKNQTLEVKMPRKLKTADL
ncbi:MAG: PDZ domain-containing protein [Flavisolibacter sp.]